MCSSCLGLSPCLRRLATKQVGLSRLNWCTRKHRLGRLYKVQCLGCPSNSFIRSRCRRRAGLSVESGWLPRLDSMSIRKWLISEIEDGGLGQTSLDPSAPTEGRFGSPRVRKLRDHCNNAPREVRSGCQERGTRRSNTGARGPTLLSA